MGLIICPSRELARQTLQVMDEYVQALAEDGYPLLRTLLCIGGVDVRSQVRSPSCPSPSFWYAREALTMRLPPPRSPLALLRQPP